MSFISTKLMQRVSMFSHVNPFYMHSEKVFAQNLFIIFIKYLMKTAEPFWDKSYKNCVDVQRFSHIVMRWGTLYDAFIYVRYVCEFLFFFIFFQCFFFLLLMKCFRIAPFMLTFLFLSN